MTKQFDLDAQIKAYRGLQQLHITETQKKMAENLSKQAIYYAALIGTENDG